VAISDALTSWHVIKGNKNELLLFNNRARRGFLALGSNGKLFFAP
jgi:hypothetical protein